MIPNWSWNWESWLNSGLFEIWHSGRSAGKRRTVRRSWELSTRGSAEKLSTAEIHCGQSACAGQFWPEAVSVSWQCKKFKGGRSARISRTVRDWTERWGRPDLTYIGCPSHNPHQTAHITKRLSLFLSQARGGDDKVKAFWSGSRTVRAHPRTLLKIVHHVLSVFWRIPNSCSWISLLERVRVRCSNMFLAHGFLKILGGSCS